MLMRQYSFSCSYWMTLDFCKTLSFSLPETHAILLGYILLGWILVTGNQLVSSVCFGEVQVLYLGSKIFYIRTM